MVDGFPTQFHFLTIEKQRMQRIFIDSRDRVSGVNEEFTISLPKSIVVPFESLAVLDTVLIPN